MTAMKYLVVLEQGDAGFSAYVPDLPGCIAAGTARDEVIGLIQEAIELHLESLKEAGEPIPKPTSEGELIDVRAA
jgi:predicted RNase H-like HicB family nuclease